MDQKSLKKQPDSEFICKLCDMIEKYQTIINWNQQGQKMIIFDIGKMEQVVLPQYFRHSNFASFVRQLNMYDFHKLYKQEKQIGFQNQFFKRGNEKNFHFIQRKKKIKQQQMVSQQFSKKNNHIISRLIKEPKISFQIKSTIQGLLEYKYTAIQNTKKIKDQLENVHRQLKDCRSKKITQALKNIKNKLMQEMNEQIKLSLDIDQFLETSFMQQKQNKQVLVNQMSSQYYLPLFTEDKHTIKDIFFDCNRIHSSHSFIAMPSYYGFLSANDGNNTHPLFFSQPQFVSQINQGEGTILKQEQPESDQEESVGSMDRVDEQQLKQIQQQKQKMKNKKKSQNIKWNNIKLEAP